MNPRYIFVCDVHICRAGLTEPNVREVTGVLLLWRRGVSTGIVACTRKSRHIQTDSRQRQDRTRNKEGGPVGRTSDRVWPREVDKRTASSGGRWGVAQEK